MSDGLGKDQDSMNNRHWLTTYENNCIDDYENANGSLSAVKTRTEKERDMACQKMFLAFQNSAGTISVLYREGGPNPSLWLPFQNAASNVTKLYKDGIDLMNKCFEMGKQYGHLRRNDDLIAWARMNERHIRREEVIGYLCGKNRSPHRRNSGLRRNVRPCPSPRHNAQRQRTADPSASTTDLQLQPFYDAAQLSGLNDDMSRVGLTSSGNTAAACGSAANGDDNHDIAMEEIDHRNLGSRKRKDHPSSPEPIFDSKRCRFF